MNRVDTASVVAQVFGMDFDDDEILVRSALALGQLDGLAALGLKVEDRARLCLAIIKMAVSDETDGEITLAFNWRKPLSALTDLQLRMELLFKGWYAVNAVTRVMSAKDRTAAVRRENVYRKQHLKASAHRTRVRRLMDTLVGQYGDVLGWYSVLKDSTTPECRWAHGKNFRVSAPPVIGYPGMVHGECACTPGPPHANGEMMS